MSTTRAKFRCNSITAHDGGHRTIKMLPVQGYGDHVSEENKKFFAYTPSGSIEMTVSKECQVIFELGKEYFVDFTLAE